MRRRQSRRQVSELPQAVLEHSADLFELVGLRMFDGEERAQVIEPQKCQADELGRAIVKVGAYPAQKKLARFDRSTSRINEHRTLRFDRLIASRHDAVKQNDLQQPNPANSKPAVQAGGVKFRLQRTGVGKELRDRNDAIAGRADRDINLQQRYVEVTLGLVDLIRRASELSGDFPFQGLHQIRIGRKGLAGEIPPGAVNDLSIRSPNLDGNDLPIQ